MEIGILIAVFLFFAMVVGRLSSTGIRLKLNAKRRQGQTGTTPQTDSRSDKSGNINARPEWRWIYIALGIVGGVIAVVALVNLFGEKISPSETINAYPRLPSTPKEAWLILIAVPGLTALGFLLRKEGNRPHLIAAGILAIFTIIIIGLALIQSGENETKTYHPNVRRSFVWTGPGVVRFTAYRNVTWNNAVLVKKSISDSIYWEVEGTERIDIEIKLNERYVVLIRASDTHFNMDEIAKSLYTIRFRPVSVPEAKILVRVWREPRRQKYVY